MHEYNTVLVTCVVESMYWSPVAIDVTPLSAKDVDTCLNQLEVDLARDTTDRTAHGKLRPSLVPYVE